MTPVPLPEIILSKLEREHRGKDFAIHIEELLKYLKGDNPQLTNRKLREGYEGLPVHGTNEGLFVPGSTKEKQELIELCEMKIRAYARKRKALKNYTVKDGPIQLRLF